MPPFDNYDGAEKFWQHYELSLLDDETVERLTKQNRPYSQSSEWLYVWMVCLYYAIMVLGGNELQPAALNEMVFLIMYNILGIIIVNYFASQISVIVVQMNKKQNQYQDEIDVVNTAMENAGLPSDLKEHIREYFLKVQSTMS